MSTVPKTRVVVGDDGVINAFLHPSIMYDKAEFLRVQEGIIGAFHPLCCSGLNIAYKMAVDEI